MNNHRIEKKWFSIGDYKSINCCNCNKPQHNVATIDHHPRICPDCNVTCIWYDLSKNRVIQIIPEIAPESVKIFLNWAQSELDELEVFDLLAEFENIGRELKRY